MTRRATNLSGIRALILTLVCMGGAIHGAGWEERIEEAQVLEEEEPPDTILERARQNLQGRKQRMLAGGLRCSLPRFDLPQPLQARTRREMDMYVIGKLLFLCALITTWGCGEPDSNEKFVDPGPGPVDLQQEADAGEEADSTAMGEDAVWPNQNVSRSPTTSTLEECFGSAKPHPYFGTYRIETTCGAGASVVVSVDDVWYESEVFRPRVNDTIVPTAYPALLGTVSVTGGEPFWQNAYFYAQCSGSGLPPRGIAFDLVGPEAVYISCYAGVGRDAQEVEQCLAISNEGNIKPADCAVTAIPL